MTGFVCIENPPLDKALTNKKEDKNRKSVDKLKIMAYNKNKQWIE